ncbi:MAG: PLDc N-terminal domain-containing protein [Gammaproteobacteria bacterium]|nr:PLDc N-terminal domain-containing protein [Gammaproteobacteria bacterium]MCP5201775.1 PLDc N-terminal domain-containing protein [Gammaproteobacteria bacterium]
MESLRPELLRDLPVWFWVVVHSAPAAWCVYHALLYKRDPRAATGWIMACLFVPVLGPLAYFFFGINRIHRRARSLRRPLYAIEYEGLHPREGPRVSGDVGLAAAGALVTGAAVVPGNVVTPMHNGDEAYPAMIEAIGRARHRVLLATYIMNADGAGQAFATALTAAVERGVTVQVLLDGIGEWYSMPRIARRLARGGVLTATFLRPRLLPPSIYLNLRNHRKMLVVDDAVGFVGGMNISDGNRCEMGRPRRISDIHFRLEGPVVATIAEVFRDDWAFATGKSPPVPVTDLPRAGPGGLGCRVIPDGPSKDLDALALTIQAAIGCAARAVDIMTPYFLPGRDLIASLVSASLRGVRVRIVLPAQNNLVYVHWANRNTLAELLQWGIEVYYQPPPFCHSKLFCVDDEYSLIGSANLDARSLRLNFEIGVEVFGAELNAALRAHVDAVIAHSQRLELGELDQRPVLVRLRDSAAALVSPYL